MLIRVAEDRNDRVAIDAVAAIGRMGVDSPEVVDCLAKILRNPDDGRPGRRDRQVDAACALARLAPVTKKALPSLREAQLSDYALTRLAATSGLLQAGDANTTVEQLLGAWADTYDPEESYPVLEHVLSELEQCGPLDTSAVPKLIALLVDPVDRFDEDYRTRTARVLIKIGPTGKAALPHLKELAAGSAGVVRLQGLLRTRFTPSNRHGTSSHEVYGFGRLM